MSENSSQSSKRSKYSFEIFSPTEINQSYVEVFLDGQNMTLKKFNLKWSLIKCKRILNDMQIKNFKFTIKNQLQLSALSEDDYTLQEVVKKDSYNYQLYLQSEEIDSNPNSDDESSKYIYHEYFGKGNSNCRTFSQSLIYLSKQNRRLPSLKEAQDYLKREGPLSIDQLIYSPTLEQNHQTKNWIVSGTDAKNFPEIILGSDYYKSNKIYPSWAEDIKWNHPQYGICTWAANALIYVQM